MKDSSQKLERAYRLGIIASRHDMPVDEYLVEAVNPGQSAYDQVYTAICTWFESHPGMGSNAEHPLEVYYSGLTEATLAVTDAIHNLKRPNVLLMRFDRELQDYEPLHRRLGSCSEYAG